MAEPAERAAADFPDDRAFTLGDAWAIGQMQMPVVLGALALSMLVAIVYCLVATRFYTAASVVHLAPNAGQEIESGERVVDDLTAGWNRQMYLATQISIL